MERRNLDILSWSIIVSLGLLVASFAALYHLTQQQQAYWQGNGDNGTQNSQRTSSPVEAIPQLRNAKGEQRNGNRPAEAQGTEKQEIQADVSRSDSNAEVAHFTKYLVIVSAIAAAFQIVAIITAIFATLAARRSANAAAIAAEATKESVGWAQESDKRIQRAYVYIAEISAVVGVAREIHFSIGIANCGASPAFDITRSEFGIVKDVRQGVAEKQLANAVPKNDPIFPALTPIHGIVGVRPVGQIFRDVVLSQDMFAFGTIGWTDIFGEKHVLEFLYRLLPGTAANGETTIDKFPIRTSERR